MVQLWAWGWVRLSVGAWVRLWQVFVMEGVDSVCCNRDRWRLFNLVLANLDRMSSTRLGLCSSCLLLGLWPMYYIVSTVFLVTLDLVPCLVLASWYASRFPFLKLFDIFKEWVFTLCLCSYYYIVWRVIQVSLFIKWDVT